MIRAGDPKARFGIGEKEYGLEDGDVDLGNQEMIRLNDTFVSFSTAKVDWCVCYNF